MTGCRKCSTDIPVVKDGYVYANEKPGWGVEINEKAAAKYPFGTETGERKGIEWRLGRRAPRRRHRNQPIRCSFG